MRTGGYRGKRAGGWAVVLCGAVLAAAALPVRFLAYGFSFTAWLMLGLGAFLILFGALGQVPPGSRLKNRVRTARRALSILLALGALAAAVSAAVVARGAKSDGDPQAQYVLVLGAGLWGEQPSPVLLTRLQAAETYLKAHPQSLAVVSGGQGKGESLTEAAAMKAYLTDRGIEEDRIWTEERAASTEQNIRYSLPVLRQAGWDGSAPVALVSSEFHLWRAAYLAHKNGLETEKVGAETPWPLLRANFFLREAFALPKTLLFG